MRLSGSWSDHNSYSYAPIAPIAGSDLTVCSGIVGSLFKTLLYCLAISSIFCVIFSVLTPSIL